MAPATAIPTDFNLGRGRLGKIETDDRVSHATIPTHTTVLRVFRHFHPDSQTEHTGFSEERSFG